MLFKRQLINWISNLSKPSKFYKSCSKKRQWINAKRKVLHTHTSYDFHKQYWAKESNHNHTFLHDSTYTQLFKDRKIWSLMIEIRRVVPSERRGRDGREHKGDFWDANNFVFRNPGSSYIIMFTLWQFIKLYTNNQCTLLYTDCFNKNVYFKNVVIYIYSFKTWAFWPRKLN